MNSVIINIGLIRYILNSKYKIMSIYLITRFHEHRDYIYWTIAIYFELKIKKNFNTFNHAVTMNSVIIDIGLLRCYLN